MNLPLIRKNEERRLYAYENYWEDFSSIKEKTLFFKELETERLHLKNIGSDDREFIYKQFTNDDVNKYLYDEEPLNDINGADKIISFYNEPEPRNQHRWILVRKADGEKMATCGFHCWDRANNYCELGYDMHPDFWGNGYMTEAVTAIIAFAKSQMSVKKIDAHIYIDNVKSENVAKRQGFVLSGEKINYNFRGVDYPHNIFTLEL